MFIINNKGTDISGENTVTVDDKFTDYTKNDTYLNTETNNLYICNQNKKWEYLGNIDKDKITIVSDDDNKDVFYTDNNYIKNTKIVYGSTDLVDNVSYLKDGVLYLYYKEDDSI